MPEKVIPGPVQDANRIREAVCIHTKKIFDSCKDKDCIEDLRFFPTCCSQDIINRAISIKAGCAELLHVYVDVDSIGFNRGFFTVDVRYFYRVTADAFVGAARPVQICGLSVFDKRVILFGSEGSAKVFSSQSGSEELESDCVIERNLPTAVVEAVDPIILNMKLVDVCNCCQCDCEMVEIPPYICACFNGELAFNGNEAKRVFVTLGQFSIIRLERDTQLLIPAYDYCMPSKECTSSGVEEDPCEIFRHVCFPVDEFFPPSRMDSCDDKGSGSDPEPPGCCHICR